MYGFMLYQDSSMGPRGRLDPIYKYIYKANAARFVMAVA